MQARLFKRIGILILLTVLLAAAVTAVGISIPKQYRWDFQPGLEKKVQFNVYNSYMRTAVVELLPEGDLLEYGNISARQLTLGPKQVIPIYAWFKLPDSLPPGHHRLQFSVREMPSPGVWLTATAAVTVYIGVDVPYPGKYLTADIKVPPASVNETVVADVIANNLGTDTISDVYADVGFNDKDKTLASVTTTHAPVNGRGETHLRAEWNGNPPAGIYTANATVYWDGNVSKTQTAFIVGEKDIDLVDITKTLIAGQVNPVRFTLLNKWNEQINDVLIIIHAGTDPRFEWKAQGPPFTIYPWKTASDEYFMNVPETKLTTIDGHAEIRFGGNTKTVPLTFTITPAAETQSPAVSPTLWTVRLVFLLLLGVILFLYLKRRRRENGRG